MAYVNDHFLLLMPALPIRRFVCTLEGNFCWFFDFNVALSSCKGIFLWISIRYIRNTRRFFSFRTMPVDKRIAETTEKELLLRTKQTGQFQKAYCCRVLSLNRLYSRYNREIRLFLATQIRLTEFLGLYGALNSRLILPCTVENKFQQLLSELKNCTSSMSCQQVFHSLKKKS